jgi:hypothetical protein
MRIQCLCGNSPSNTAYPDNIQHVLLDAYAVEKLQDAVDEEVKESGVVDMWPEHWDSSGAIEVWKCLECERLHFYPKGDPKDALVYKLERKGLLES